MYGSRSMRPLDSAVAGGENLVRSRGFEWLARAGFVARAVVYVTIGVLALKLAFGLGGTPADQRGALHAVAHQPFGRFLLTLVAIGLGGYSLWRLVRAAIGHGPEGSHTGLDRVSALGCGVAYGALGTRAVRFP